MPADHERLSAIQSELEAVLEERLTALLAQVKACQEVTARIASANIEIQRQEELARRLEREIAPLGAEADKLRAENEASRARLDKLREAVERMRALRSELASSLAGLTGELGEK